MLNTFNYLSFNNYLKTQISFCLLITIRLSVNSPSLSYTNLAIINNVFLRLQILASMINFADDLEILARSQYN